MTDDGKLFATKSAQELLVEFNQTGRQRPFEEIVRRYAGMVYSVCLRVTKNPHDAEDATQAVFLALAAQGRTGKPVKYIGPWLQQVGRRLSLDIRRSRKRRTRREEIVGEMHRENGNNGNGGNGVASCPSHQLGQAELRAMLTEELNQLPSKYRLPLILHYFGGLSRDEMAKELGVKANTLGVRVCRGRDMLAKRLATRGVTIGAAALAVLLADSIRETVTDTLIASTCHAATRYAVTSGAGEVASSVVSAQIVALAESVTRALLLAKVKGITALVLVAFTAIAGGAGAMGGIRDLKLPFSMPLDLAGQIRAILRDIARPIRLTSATPGESIVPDVTEKQLLGETKSAGDFAYLASHAQDEPLAATAMASISRTHHAAGMGQTWSQDGTGFGAAPFASRVLNETPAPRAPVVVTMPVARASAPIVPPRPPAPTRATIASATPSQNVTIDAPRGGAAASRTLAHGQSMAPVNLTVGDRGAATFHQTGGSNRIANQLVLGAQRGSSGTYKLDDGELSAREQIIGKGGTGKLEQTGGTNTVEETVYVGFDKGSQGTYTLAGDGRLIAGQLYVPKDGNGTFNQTGGTTTLIADAGGGAETPDLIVASEPGSTGTYTLSNGTLQAEHQVIGNAGSGAFVHFGGVNDVALVDLGAEAEGDGHYLLKSGAIRLDNVEVAGDATVGSDVRPEIRIGGAGDGSFQLGSLNRRATIIDLHGDTGLTVRTQESASGEFRGWGVVGLQGPFVNNGQVIADGFGTARALDFTSAASVSNVINNEGGEDDGGWFARRGGRLLLPPIPTRMGAHDYTWGEDENDESLDLINSVRVRLSGVTKPGEIRIALFALDRVDLPTLPGGHNFISAWSFDAGETEFGHALLTIRYDDRAAASLHLDENVLKLWRYDDGAWQRMDNNEWFGRDVEQNLVWGRTDELSFFAVSAPEPSCVGAIVLSAWALLRRVRRRSSPLSR